jgi:hypothetical protein
VREEGGGGRREGEGGGGGREEGESFRASSISMGEVLSEISKTREKRFLWRREIYKGKGGEEE